MRWLAGVALAGCLLSGKAASAQSSSPVGYWFTEDRKGIIQVKPCGEVLCGSIVGLLGGPPQGPAAGLPRPFAMRVPLAGRVAPGWGRALARHGHQPARRTDLQRRSVGAARRGAPAARLHRFADPGVDRALSAFSGRCAAGLSLLQEHPSLRASLAYDKPAYNFGNGMPGISAR